MLILKQTEMNQQSWEPWHGKTESFSLLHTESVETK